MSTFATAFIKAKRAFGPALKDKTNPAFRSKYADLGACIDAVEDALLQNAIAFIQETSQDDTGVTVETVFLHESGEERRCGKLHVPASKQDPQGYGSALTYARRYSLMAACGIAPEDDDGNAASRPRTAPNLVNAKTGEALQGKPLDEQLAASIEAERRKRVEAMDELALEIIDAWRVEDKPRTATLWFNDAAFKSADERAYCWGLLKTESALRAHLQANSPHRDHTPAPAVVKMAPGPGLKKVGVPVNNGASQ